MLGYSTKSCYILKDQIETFVYAQVLKLLPEQKMVMVNMTTCLHIGKAKPIIIEVEPIPEAELWIINSNQGNQQEKAYICIPTPKGERLWVHPHLLYVEDWSSSTSMNLGGKYKKSKSKGKGNLKPSPPPATSWAPLQGRQTPMWSHTRTLRMTKRSFTLPRPMSQSQSQPDQAINTINSKMSQPRIISVISSRADKATNKAICQANC